MKNYLKNEIRHLPFVVIVFVLFYGVVVFATEYLATASEVKFDNTNNADLPDNTQDVIDNVFLRATNYNGLGARIDAIDSIIGNNTLTTTAQNLIGATNEIESEMSSALDGNLKIGTSVMYISESKNFQVPSSSRHLIVIETRSANYQGLFMLTCNASGTMYLTQIYKGSGLTVTSTTSTLTITGANTAGSTTNVRVYDFCFLGDLIKMVD